SGRSRRGLHHARAVRLECGSRAARGSLPGTRSAPVRDRRRSRTPAGIIHIERRREELATYFREFSKRNHARPTRLEIFGELGAQSEESHLPLGGISVENTGKDAPRIEIMLGGNSLIDPRHLTHT